MNEMTISTTLTMTSLELVELINKSRDKDEAKLRHDHFMVKVPAVLGKSHAPKFLGTQKYGNNNERKIYNFPEREACLMAMSYSYELQAMVYDRWRAMEAQVQAQQPAIPQDYVAALRLAADLEEQKQLLQIENGQLAEQIGYLKNLFQEGMTVPQFCKQLNGVNVQQVNGFLQARSWLFHQAGQWRVAAYARDKYLTEHQSTITPHGKDPFIRHKPVLLKAGAARLHQIYLQGELPMKKSWDGQYTHDLEARS